jgi:bacterioferritin (cytochrome b1)
MEKDAVLKELTLFTSLEFLQVTLYKRNINATDNEHWRYALERFVDIEEGHVDRLTQHIKLLGGKPNKVIDLAVITLGTLGAEAAEALGLDKVVMAGIAIENKASEMYQKLIQQINRNEQDIASTLWGNQVQEEMHALWLNQWRINMIDSTGATRFFVQPATL